MGRGLRYGSGKGGGVMAAKYGDAPSDDLLEDVTLEELREFLEADGMDVQVDSEFKESLRKKLWKLVQAQNDEPPSGGSR